MECTIPTIGQVRRMLNGFACAYFGIYVNRPDDGERPDYWIRASVRVDPDDNGQEWLDFEIMYHADYGQFKGMLPYRATNAQWQSQVAYLCGYCLGRTSALR